MKNSLAQQHLHVRQTENDKSFIAVLAYFVTILFRASHEASVATCLRCGEKYRTILLGVYSLCSVERIFFKYKSVKIRQSWHQNLAAPFLSRHGVCSEGTDISTENNQ